MAGGDENASGVSSIASRFEQPAADAAEPNAKITDLASRFEGATVSSSVPTYKPKVSSASPTTTAGGAAAIAAKNAPVKEGGNSAGAEEETKSSVADVAARFNATQKPAKGRNGNEEEEVNAFSSAKNAFQKAEAAATRPADGETKIMAAASMFGDTLGSKPGSRPSPAAAPAKKKTPAAAEEIPSRVSTESGPGVAAAAALFQSNRAKGGTAGEEGAEGEEESGSERFANAAAMFGGK